MEKADIVLEESTPLRRVGSKVRRVGSKVRMLAAALVGLTTAGGEAAVASSDYPTLRNQADIARRNRIQKAVRYVSRTGEPHGRSGDKLIRKAMRRQVGKAVLR